MDPKARPTAAERQAALDNIPGADLAKIRKGTGTGSVKVDNEWLILAEFAKHFGWEAYKDARNDNVSSEEMMTLIAAARKLDNLSLYRSAKAVLLGTGSAQSKNPGEAFKRLTQDILNDIKADE